MGIDKEKRKHAQRLFQCLSVSIRLLRIEELAEILAVQFDDMAFPSFNEDFRPLDAEEAVLSACSSFVAIVDTEGGRFVQFSHFSVKEFLTSDRLATADECLSCYHILPELAHTVLAHAGLSILLRLDDKIDINAFPSLHMPLNIGSTMPGLATCHPKLRKPWNDSLIQQSHISRPGSGSMI